MIKRNAQQRLIAKIVDLGNTMIKRNAQQRLIAKIVELGNTMIKLERLIAKIVERENTMIKRNAQQRLIAKIVELENIMIKRDKMIVKLIATLDHTLYLTKVRVLFVRKVSGKIKMDSQLVAVVDLENTMIKRNAKQRLIAKIVELENIMI
jgi:hypothetical protein